MRMRLKAAKRSESPTALLEQLKRIHQQTVVTKDGKTLCGLTQMTAQQKSLFAALELTPPSPADFARPRKTCFVVCALDRDFNEIIQLRAGSVELELHSPPQRQLL